MFLGAPLVLLRRRSNPLRARAGIMVALVVVLVGPFAFLSTPQGGLTGESLF